MDSSLAQQRAPIRAMVTKLRARAEYAISSELPTVAEGILSSLTDKVQQLRILDKKVFDNWNKDDDEDNSLLDKEVEQVMDYDIDANVTISELKTFLSRCNQSHNSSVEPIKASVRLPKIDLPKFGGCKLQWSSFWEIFEVSIHKNPQLACIQKFSYLISCLTGEAKSAVSGLCLSGDNYTEAVKILSDRFGDKTEVSREHLRCLQNLRRVSNTTSQLRQFCDDIHVHSRNLSKVGIPTSDYEVMLVPQLMGKLPEQVQWSLLHRASMEGSSISNLEYFLSRLETEIKVRNSIQSDEAHVHVTKEAHLPASRIHSAAALTTGAQAKGKCPFCDADHKPSVCPVTDVKTRIQIIKQKGLCFRCLAKGHVGKQCRSQKKCSRCSKQHHVTICHQANQKPANTEDRSIGNTEASNDVSLLIRSSSSVVMPTAKAILKSSNSLKEMTVRILFDSGSNKTFIRQDVCDQLGIESMTTQKLLVNTFGKSNSEEHECGTVRFLLRKPDSHDLFELNGFTVPSICGTQMSAALGQFPHFNGLDLADSVDIRDPTPGEISILVGADQFYDIVLGEVRRGDYGPAAISSKLGWMACGPLSLADDTKLSNMDNSLTTHVSILHCDSLSKELHKFWDLEHIGIAGKEEIPPFLSLPIKMADGRYETPLPWKDDKETLKLPTNFGVASRRLRTTLRHLKSQPDLVDKYQEIIEDQLEQGVLETVPENSSEETVHYLPHSPVIRPTAESTKIRIVLDASSKQQGRPSLNDCLQTGTNDLPHVASLVCGFRFSPIAILADIEKAFLQISIPPGDRDVLRILWVNDPKKIDQKMIVYRYTRLVFGLTASPAVLNSVLDFHISKLSETDPVVFSKLNGHLYVDNLVTGCNSLDEAKHLNSVTKSSFQEANFNMRQWKSNSSEFKQFVQSVNGDDVCDKRIPGSQEESIANEQLNPNLNSVNEKVLGVEWDATIDEFVFDLRRLSCNDCQEPTKRTVLCTIASVYDPLGILSPIMVQAKLLFQKLCNTLHWDESLQGVDLQCWKDWISKISSVNLRIPRRIHVSDDETVKIQLHGFSDASAVAYAAVIYLRITSHRSGLTFTESFLLASKSRVVPLSKTLSIPRLELLGALLLARLVNFFMPIISKHCQLQSNHLWTDSRNVLCWIHGTDKVWKVFVENRICEIRTLTQTMKWHHIAGKDNPADLPSRGMSPDKLGSCSWWWKGPRWLQFPEHQWPKSGNLEDEQPLLDLQIETKSLVTSAAAPVMTISSIISLSSYNSLRKLLRVTAYVLRFLNCVRKQRNPSPNLTSDEISQARKTWLVNLQSIHLFSELRQLQKKGPATSRVRNLRLFVDNEGLLRSRGRTSSTSLPDVCDDPILLPPVESFEKLVILDAHDVVCHGGISATLAKVRDEFWLLKGRQKVKKVLNRCVSCKRVQGLPYASPQQPNIPDFRLSTNRAFATVGIDYCGPLYVSIRKGEENCKAYIILFTCAATRALHLEVVTNLTTRSFLLALKRFVSRRGIPNVVSDNASTFKSAAAIINRDQVQSFASQRMIKWEFITQYAPWRGGFYERLIKDVKLSLKKVLNKQHLTLEELTTVSCEIEGALNSRPLTYVGEENVEVLTPSHFLVLQRLTKPGNGQNCALEGALPNIKLVRARVNAFWDMWKKDYVASLRERSLSGVNTNRGTPEVPKVGDVCLLTEKTPRLQWRLARIVDLCPGRDGVVRSVIVRLANGREVKRPVSLLVPVERE